MKLIYQNLLGFLVVILTSVSIIGYSEIKYESVQSYQNNYKRLEGYAQALGNMAKSDGDGKTAVLSNNFLNKLQFVFRDDQVSISIFDKNGQQIYPKSAGEVKLRKGVLKTLKSGKEIRISNTQREKATKKTDKVAFTGVFVPWFSGKTMIGVIWIGARVNNIERPIQMAKRNLVNALIISIAVALLLSIIMSYYQSNKIKRLSLATKKVAQGDFEVQLPHRNRDEIDELAGNFNKMVRTLKRSDEEVKAQEKRRDQFLADAAHEMRTPLTTINGILEGLQYDVIPEEDKPKSIELMQHETKRLIRLVNENLDYEKIRKNKVVLLKSEFDAKPLLDDVKEQLSGNAKKSDNELILKVPKKLPTYADPDRFTQIMVNLIQNAIQFTEHGQIQIVGRRIPHGSQFQVIDNGIGMSQEQMKYIFERFFKADPSRARLGTGESGLGLAIVSSLIKQHGGKIDVSSEPNKGSTFTIELYDKGYEQKAQDDHKKTSSWRWKLKVW